MANEVKFYSGTQSNYDALSPKDNNALYFTIDTHKVYKGSQLYGGDISGLIGAMHFKGILTTLPTDFTNYNPGDVVIVGNKEYVCVDSDGTKSWHELGDESIYAIKGQIKNDDISNDANIAQSKIANLTTDLGNKVSKTGNESINGVKTFNSGVVVPDVNGWTTPTIVEGGSTQTTELQAASTFLRADNETTPITLNSDKYTDVFLLRASEVVFEDGFTGKQVKTFYVNSGITLKSTSSLVTKINVDFTEHTLSGAGYTTAHKMFFVGYTVSADSVVCPLFITDSVATSITYTFTNGTTGNFTVTPSDGVAQTVSVGKPTTAGTADKVAHKLTIGTQVYDGSADMLVSAPPTWSAI